MAGGKGRRDAVRAFYEGHLKPLEFGMAVADVILVPPLALSLVGVIDIPGPTDREVVAFFAIVDVISTAILLVAGYIGHTPRIACANCQGIMKPTTSKWTCEDCGWILGPKKRPVAGGK